jgi:protein tyrosine/serine phosphatase
LKQIVAAHPGKYQVPGTKWEFSAATAKKSEVRSAAIEQLRSSEELKAPEFNGRDVNQELTAMDAMQKAFDVDIPAVRYNECKDWNPDHWFELPIRNSNLFTTLTLQGVADLLPGRLYTTRMPRKLTTEPAEAKDFEDKAKALKLHTVLILTEPKEYADYAGTNLEAFYTGIGLQFINRPIVDFSVPNNKEMVDNILDVTRLLSEGKNVLIHCAGGSGRTGLVVAGVLRQCGIADPIVWARQVKSTYVETNQQEEFVFALPVALDEALAKKNPQFAQAVACEMLVNHAIAGTDLSKLATVEMKQELQDVYKATFDLLDKDKSGFIDMHEVLAPLKKLGVEDFALEAIKRKPAQKIDLKTFFRLMVTPPKVVRSDLFDENSSRKH